LLNRIIISEAVVILQCVVCRILDPQGKKLGRIVHGHPATTNLAFGGDDRKTLYFTSRTHLGSVQSQDRRPACAGGGSEKIVISRDSPGIAHYDHVSAAGRLKALRLKALRPKALKLKASPPPSFSTSSIREVSKC
jgi:hypothetical protein